MCVVHVLNPRDGCDGRSVTGSFQEKGHHVYMSSVTAAVVRSAGQCRVRVYLHAFAKDLARTVWVSGTLMGPMLRLVTWRHPEDVEFRGDVWVDCPGSDTLCSGPSGAQVPLISNFVFLGVLTFGLVLVTSLFRAGGKMGQWSEA